MGIMYCGFYGAEGKPEQECFFYIAVNMHWQVNYMGLPKLPKGKCWVYRASTGKELPEIEEEAASQEICVPARTIVLCTTKDVPVETEKPARKNAKAERAGKKGLKKPDE